MSDDQGEAIQPAGADLRVSVARSVEEGVLDDGSTVLLDTSSGAMARLDVIGALMWQGLRMTSSTVDELATDLADAFEQPLEVTAPAAEELVGRLASLGLVDVASTAHDGTPDVDEARRVLSVLPDPPSP